MAHVDERFDEGWPDDPIGTVRVTDGVVAVRGRHVSEDELVWYMFDVSSEGNADFQKLQPADLVHWLIVYPRTETHP